MQDFITAQDVSKIFGHKKGVSHALELLQTEPDPKIIRKKTESLVAVNNVSLSIHQGELFVLMGLSGSGKSTFLRCVNGIIPATVGTITIDGHQLNPHNKAQLIALRRKYMAMVFQHFGLLPHRTVRSNVGLGLEIQGISAKAREGAVSEAIERVGLRDWSTSLPAELSGGMQQRVGLARALATGAPILLMDEPFSALDPLIRREMQNELLRLQRDLNRTIVFVTHDLNEAMKLGDRIGVMRDGALVQVGTAEEILSNPADQYVAQFVEDIDRSRALTASAIMRDTEVLYPTVGPRHAVRYMRQLGLSSIFVIERNGELLGILNVDKASSAIEQGASDIRKFVKSEVFRVFSDDPIVDVARKIVAQRVPAAVVDSSNKFLGIITWVDIVATIGSVNSFV